MVKTSDLEVGKWYNIRYRTSIKKLRARSTWSGNMYTIGYAEPLKTGVGQLVKLGSGSAPTHEFRVPEEHDVVYASPNSIKSEASPPNVGLSSSIPVSEIAKRVEKLRSIGYDDNLRREVVERIQGFLTTLNIESKPDEQYTGVTIPYASLASLEALIGVIFKKTLFDEVDL